MTEAQRVMFDLLTAFDALCREIVRHKKPVAYSDIPIFHELYSEIEMLLFILEDISSLVEAVKVLQKKKERLTRNVYKKYLGNFTTEKMAENYLALYRALRKESVVG